jgi:hypothetical protein
MESKFSWVCVPWPGVGLAIILDSLNDVQRETIVFGHSAYSVPFLVFG